MDPYEILGLPRTASLDEVRSRYLTLARKHHPDKHMHLPEDERKTQEETFQKISAAYHYILEKGSGDGGGEEDGAVAFDWRAIWDRITADGLLDKLKGVFQNTVYEYFRQNPRTFRAKLSLQDIHRNTPKTYRIHVGKHFPFVFTVKPSEILACDDWVYEPLPGIQVIAMAEDHPVYRVDALVYAYDLYATQDLTLQEYMCGTVRHLPAIDSDRDPIVVERPAFWPLDQPVTVCDAGLAGRGDLIVSWSLQLPLNRANALNEVRTILEVLETEKLTAI